MLWLHLNRQSPDRPPPLQLLLCQWPTQPNSGSVQFFGGTESLPTSDLLSVLSKIGEGLIYNIPFNSRAFHGLRLNLKHRYHREPECNVKVEMHWDHGAVCERFICFPISQSDERRWMSFCSGGCKNLFRVIESAEQKRQTSALKSFSAWAERAIFTISPVNMVPSASNHECYQ